MRCKCRVSSFLSACKSCTRRTSLAARWPAQGVPCRSLQGPSEDLCLGCRFPLTIGSFSPRCTFLSGGATQGYRLVVAYCAWENRGCVLRMPRRLHPQARWRVRCDKKRSAVASILPLNVYVRMLGRPENPKHGGRNHIG